MQPGYYWARCGPTYRPKQYGDTWRVVQVVAGLHTAVLDRGYAVKLSEYSEFVGPMVAGDDAEWEAIVTEQAERLHQYAEYYAEYEVVWNRKQTELRAERDDLAAKLDFMRKVAEDWEDAHDDLRAKLEVANAELDELRIRLGELPECQ